MPASKRYGGGRTAATFLDLYSGCGGLSFGFELTGAFRCLAGLDHYARALETFYHNHPDAGRQSRELRQPIDLGVVDPEQVRKWVGSSPDVIVGGPPCQGFSVAGPRTATDDRRIHVAKFQEFVLTLRPRAFVMENVSGLLVTAQKQRGEVLAELLEGYRAAGYCVSWEVLNSCNYRVPQKRKRLFIVGLADGTRFEFPAALSGQESTLFERGEPFVTVGDALDDLPSPTPEEPQPYNGPPETWFQEFLRAGSTVLQGHRQTHHGEKMVERLKQQEIGTRLYPDWNHSWYRLDPQRPSPAVKENHRAPFVHHREPRSTSPRECARLQSFPDRYEILGTKTDQLIQIGNAVPPLLAAAIATQLARSLGIKPIQLPGPTSASERMHAASR